MTKLFYRPISKGFKTHWKLGGTIIELPQQMPAIYYNSEKHVIAKDEETAMMLIRNKLSKRHEGFVVTDIREDYNPEGDANDNA